MGQQYVPKQQEQPVTRLKESAGFQLHMFLLKVGIVLDVEGGRCFLVSVDGCLESRNLVSYHVLNRANPLGIHTDIRTNQKPAEESSKSSTDV